MRFRAGSTLIYPLLLALTVSSGLIFNVGCGGGSSDPKPSQGGGTTPTPTPTPTPVPAVKVNVKPAVLWAPRSRDFNVNQVGGPSSALSVRFQLNVLGTSTVLVNEVFNRTVPVAGSPQTQNYTTQAQVFPGDYTLSAQFYAGKDGGGALVGTAAAQATVKTDGTLTFTIATNGTVKSVVVAPNQSVNVGETKFIQYTAYGAPDQNNNKPVIAVSPGSAFVQIVDATSTVPPAPSIAVSGESVTGQNPATAKIQVKVDDATSPATDISVRSNQTLTVTPANATISYLESQAFTATVNGDGPKDVTFAVQEGDIAGTLVQNGSSATITASRNPGTYHLVVASKYDPNANQVIPFTVQSLVTVTVQPNPAPAISFKGGQQQFTATVTHVPQGQDQVTWTVEPADAGTITPDGLFTAGNTKFTGNNKVTVRATSVFDTSKSGTASFNIQSIVQGSIDGADPTVVSINAQHTFTATINTGIAGGDVTVTWSIAPAPGTPPGANIGSIDPNTGVYTAPPQPVDLLVTATSNFDPDFKTKSVKVQVRSGDLNVGVN